MASFKSNPLFFGALLACGVASAGQAWLIYSQRSALSGVEAQIEQKRQALANLSGQNPFPSDANLKAVEANLAAVEATRKDIRDLLQSRTETATRIAAAKVPGTSLDAYFDIANFVEGVRTSVKTKGVAVAADNRFGFNLYDRTGPAPELIPLVFRQRQHLEYLINALIASAPTEIGEIRRERPVTAEQQRQIDEALAAGGQPPSFATGEQKDYFVIDPRTTAKVAGFVSTDAYRLSFRGNTLVLRAFLNELARFELPVVVRSVEVAASTSTVSRPVAAPATNSLASIFGDAAAPATPQAEQAKPLVDQDDSSFSVTVEIVSLVEKPAEDAPAAETAATNP